MASKPRKISEEHILKLILLRVEISAFWTCSEEVLLLCCCKVMSFESLHRVVCTAAPSSSLSISRVWHSSESKLASLSFGIKAPLAAEWTT